MVDYKFRYIIDDGKKKTCMVVFYEGDITTEDQINPMTGQMEPVTRYRRTSKLEEKDIDFVDKNTEEIKSELNTEVSKKGEPIDEQKPK